MLLLILNSEIPSKYHDGRKAREFYKNSLFFIDKRKLLPLEMMMIRRIAMHKILKSMEAPGILLKHYASEKQEAVMLDKVIGSANRKLLLEGGRHLKLHILINSCGGSQDTEFDILHIVDWVKLMKGKTIAYAFREASSAAASIFSSADVKYAMRNTYLFYHKGYRETNGHTPPDQKLLRQFDHEDYMIGIRKFFAGHKDAFKKEIGRIMKRAIEEERELTFTGSAFEKYGIVKKAYLSPYRLTARFLSDACIKREMKDLRLWETLFSMQDHYALTKDNPSPYDKFAEFWKTIYWYYNQGELQKRSE